ncbi:flagellar assembly protein FliH [Gammaproteobacteria bacterium]
MPVRSAWALAANNMSRGFISKEELSPDFRRWELPGIDGDLFVPPPPASPSTFSLISPLSLSSPDSTSESSTSEVESEDSPAEESVHRLPTVEEIESISRAAYEEAFERGQQEGMTQGFEQGHRDGLAQGIEEGTKQGIEEGTKQGFEQGLKQGLEQGLEQGLQQGTERGLEQGLQQGIDQGHKQGFEQGQREGLAQGLEEGRRDGLAQGFEKGHRDGLEQGDAEVQDKLERLGQFLTLLDQPLADLDHEVEEQLLALVVAVARQVVRRELHLSPGEIIHVVREALTSLPTARRNLRVFLHPDDISLVRSALGAALGAGEGEREVRIVEDAALTRGGGAD